MPCHLSDTNPSNNRCSAWLGDGVISQNKSQETWEQAANQRHPAESPKSRLSACRTSETDASRPTNVVLSPCHPLKRSMDVELAMRMQLAEAAERALAVLVAQSSGHQ